MEAKEVFRINQLECKVAILEERMNTKQAEFKTDIAQLDAHLTQLDAHLTQLDARLASRDTILKFLMFTVAIALAGLSVAVFTLL